MHEAIKAALFQEIVHDLFVREGDGWVRMVDRAYENPADDPSEEDPDQRLVVIQPATLAAEDIERRIRLAGLKKVQADKYKKTIAILELT